ncbi:MAG: alpha/beta hydrolase [Polyangiaceae bacterium]|nr:alpha/beta hydrolase [Polyangiaceae bacterium]
MSVVFRNAEARSKIEAAYERFRARLPETSSRMVKTRKGETHVLRAGNRSGPPLLLVHGAIASSAHATVELGPLLDRYDVHAVDVIGQSVKSADDRLVLEGTECGDWLTDVLDGLELERPHVYGISWGGFLSRKLAERSPHRIDHLVLLVPAGFVNGSFWAGFKNVYWPMTMYRKFPSPERLERFTRAMTSTFDPMWNEYFGEALLAYNMDMRFPPLAKPEDLAAFKRPTLVFGADQDYSFPGDKLIARVKAVLPHAEVELIENCRHAPPTDAVFRKKMADRIGAFLETSVPADATA